MEPSNSILAGRYEIRNLIGRGGMAEVRIGYDQRLGRTVAIKMLRQDLARDSIFQTRFRREAQAAARLNHPNIVAVYDTGEEGFTGADGMQVMVPYIVMEYVEGHTVRELLTDGDPVPIEEAIEIVSGVLDALEYSHHQGLVHRDIKPGNVMLTTDGKIKVMDFGIARAMEDSAATMTQTDAVVGTAQYLSPEQARGAQVDARSDLYSTGCVLFELLTGQPPFRGDSAVAVAFQHVSQLPPTPSSITPDVPEALDRVVLKALAKDPAERYADAAHMRSDLLASMRGAQVAAPPVASWTSPLSEGATTVLPPTPAPAAQARFAGGAVRPGGTTMTTTMPQIPSRSAMKKRSALPWVVTIVGLILVALVATAAYLVLTKEQEVTVEQVTVPQLTVGMEQSEVMAALQQVGLVPVWARRADETALPNTFLESDPAPGTKVDKGSKVTIYMAEGELTVEVPDLKGMTQEQAAQALKERGLEIGTVSTADDGTEQRDAIVSSDPAKGTQVDKGTKVNVVIATGNVKIPAELVGKSLETLREFALANDLLIDTSQKEESADVPADTVLLIQEAGQIVARGSTLNVILSTEPVAPVGPDPEASPSESEVAENPEEQTSPAPAPTSPSPSASPTA